MESKRRGISFRKTFFWVLGAHIVVIVALSLWSSLTPEPPPQLKFLNMMAAGQLVKGTPGPSVGPIVGPKPDGPPGEIIGKYEPAEPPAPAPAKKADPVPVVKPVAHKKPRVKTPPKVEPLEEEEIVEAETPAKPEPKPDSNAWKSKTKPTKVAAKDSAPKVKVNLEETSREDGVASASGATGKSSGKSKNGQPGGKSSGLTAGSVAQRLGQRLQASGVSSGVVTGVSGSGNGAGNEFGWYYSLIRDQMYDAWERPLNLLGKGFTTQVQIVLEKNGAIARFSILRSSGNSQHDESVLAAVRKVSRIRESLPEGMDGHVTINFKLTNS